MKPFQVVGYERNLLGTRTSSVGGFHLNLCGFGGYDFRDALERSEFPRNTYALATVRRFWVAKFLVVASPNEKRKNPIGIRLVEVQKSRTATTAFRISRTHDLAANSPLLTNMIFGLGCREGFLG